VTIREVLEAKALEHLTVKGDIFYNNHVLNALEYSITLNKDLTEDLVQEAFTDLPF
jgi:hypothetical protein